jgi:HEAT repeat protein
MPQQHPHQELYDDLVERRDIRTLIRDLHYGLRADANEYILLAVNACVDIGAEAIPHLIEALDDFALEARTAVVQQCTGRGIFASRESLRNPTIALMVDSEIQRRWERLVSNPCFPPALALARVGEPSMLPLIQYLQQDRDWLSREVAIWALGEVGDPTAIPTLSRLIRFLHWDRVSATARRAIRQIESRPHHH